MKHSLRLFFHEENLLRCRTSISSDETLKLQKEKITSLIKSKDGLVRGVKLVIYQKQRNKVHNIKRPVQLIVPMEITNTNDDITNNKDINEPAKDEKRRSQREAAKNANILRKLNMNMNIKILNLLSTCHSL